MPAISPAIDAAIDAYLMALHQTAAESANRAGDQAVERGEDASISHAVYSATFERGERPRKYLRIVQTTYGGSRHVHSFVDLATGDVLKAAGWTGPAKGARYNLLDADSFAEMAQRMDPHGSYLYAR